MAEFVLEQCRPSERAAEIKALFARAGQPEFSAVFDRVYRFREQVGLRSWIALAGPEAVLHISVAHEPFSGGASPVTGGLLGDLMADETHRDFWGPIKLARRMVTDVKKDAKLGFLFTSYLPAAEGVFRAAGFKKFATLRRYVLPIIWPYPLIRRLMHGQPAPKLSAIPFNDARVASLLTGLTSPDAFRPTPTESFYTTRMPRLEYPAGTWLVAGSADRPDAMVLVSPKSSRELLIADVLWRDASMPLSGLMSGVARWASRAGFRRLMTTTIEGSRISRAVVDAGFRVRPEEYLMMVLPLGAADAIPAAERWSLTPFMLSAW